ncbi:MAG: hypothetical protein K6F30_04680 [Lachnospiraceae bacterium]|nr:hypothetical protein [Lachnospiraceae bacterium]
MGHINRKNDKNEKNAKNYKMLSERECKKAYYMSAMSFVITAAVLMFPMVAFATQPTPPTGAEAVTSSFNSLKEIVIALVSSVGTIVLLWGFFEWGTSMQSTDGVMQSSAFKRIGGGLIMVLAPQLISAFVG